MEDVKKPVKQFYNRKTGRWHVFTEANENQPLQITRTEPKKLPGVPVCGNYSEKTESETGQSTSSKQQRNEAGDKEENNNPGFFNFL